MGILPESMPKLKKMFLKFLINGVAPVSNDTVGLSALKAAEEEHKKNYDIYSSSCKINFRDDVGLDGISLDDFSPHMRFKEIENSNTPIYSWSGWYDGAYQRSAINRYLNVKTKGSRLIIGPWDHVGNHTANPFVQVSKRKTHFDYVGEILRFLDVYLNDGDGYGVKEEHPVHYYTVGENKWKETDTWPPNEFSYTELYLGQGSTLVQEKNKVSGYSVHRQAYSWSKRRYVQVADADASGPISRKRSVVHSCQQNATTGKQSRWRSQVNVEKNELFTITLLHRIVNAFCFAHCLY